MTDDLVFVDTNVLVHAYDETDAVRGPVAERIIRELWRSDRGVLSTQVLQEFYSVATKKIKKPLSHREARQLMADYSEWCVMHTDAQLLVSASALAEKHQISWWDSLIIEAALRSGATTLLSEDLQDGRAFGTLTISNPFVGL
ncbi:PIN domain-containing protein [Actinocrispum sp. NPDC049592]|uniref:PIN domain-containing protein n=1 Tax=Actinocrispum sp. NPDC049592 TaxID=3154835 RepID=UPI00343FCCF7